MRWGQVRSEEGRTAALTVPDKYKTAHDKKVGLHQDQGSIYKVSGGQCSSPELHLYIMLSPVPAKI